jgi:Protein of unknown function (DUF3995)
MTELAGFSAVAILLALSALHVYWVLGGRWALGAVIPVVDGRPLFGPGPLGTLAVAVLLALAAWIVAGAHLGANSPWPWIYTAGPWAVAGTFLLRAVGDCRLVGFFKRVRGTPFAKWDDALYSPLCLGLALLVAVSRLAR